MLGEDATNPTRIINEPDVGCRMLKGERRYRERSGRGARPQETTRH